MPLTEAQRELWLAVQMGEDASRAFVDTITIHMRGPFRMMADGQSHRRTCRTPRRSTEYG